MFEVLSAMKSDLLQGKKLLILGASAHEIDLVRRAGELGVYTIVTDYNSPADSPAKLVADESWNISWSDIDALERKCREEQVDGVTAGYSEFRIENLIKLCKRLDLPCYCSEDQLEVTRNKELFKQTCRKYRVPVVKEYACMDSVNHFPVIVKPVDRGGSIGISIASDRAELEAAYAYAMEKSVCKRVIIEDFISNGTKFDAYYAISEGNITLLSTSDTINAKSNGTEKVVQSGWTFPSRYHARFERQVDSAIRDMIVGTGIKNGFIFFSGFVTNGDFVFFETGFRLSGSHMYRYCCKMNYPDYQDIFIWHALTGKSTWFESGAVPKDPSVKGLVMNFYATRGTLTSISGIEEIKQLDTCGFVISGCKTGTECRDDRAILTKLLMVHLYSHDALKLAEDAEKVNALYQAKDENGNDMVYDRMCRETVRNSWTE